MNKKKKPKNNREIYGLHSFHKKELEMILQYIFEVDLAEVTIFMK